MILRVGLEMFRQVVDPLAEERHLDFRRTSIALVGLVGADDFCFAVLAECHSRPPRTAQTPGGFPPPHQAAVAEFTIPTSSICYTRTRVGCKAPPGCDSAIASRPPAGSNSLILGGNPASRPPRSSRSSGPIGV